MDEEMVVTRKVTKRYRPKTTWKSTVDRRAMTAKLKDGTILFLRSCQHVIGGVQMTRIDKHHNELEGTDRFGSLDDAYIYVDQLNGALDMQTCSQCDMFVVKLEKTSYGKFCKSCLDEFDRNKIGGQVYK